MTKTMWTPAALTLLALAGCADANPHGAGQQSQQGLSEDSPVVPVDRTPPQITFDEGVRGGWAAPGPFTLSGVVEDTGTGVSVMMLSSEPVTVGEDGRFSVEVQGEHGLNVADFIVVDNSGNVSTQVISWLAAQFVPAEVLEVRAAHHRLAPSVLDAAAADAALALRGGLRPLQAGDDLLAFEDCVVLEGTVDAVQLGDPALHFSATAEGLWVEVLLSGLTLQASGTADACGVELPFSATLTQANTRLSARLELAAGPGGILVTVAESSVSLDGAIVSIPEIQEELDAHGILPDEVGLIEVVEQALADALEDALPAPIGDALAGYLPADLSFGALPGLDTQVWLADLTVGEGFLDASYDAAFPVIGGREEAEAPGWPALALPAPIANARTDVQLQVSLDALNRALFAAWASGQLQTEQPFPRSLAGNKHQYLSFQPTLPPIVQVYEDELWLAMGEVAVEYRVGEERTVQGTYRAQIFTPINLRGEPIGQPQITVDVQDGRPLPLNAPIVFRQILRQAIYPMIPTPPTLDRLANGEAVARMNVFEEVVGGWLQSAGMLRP